MPEERQVKWILGVSVVMLWASTLVASVSYSPYSRTRSTLDEVTFYINRIDILFFIATIATATLATTGYGNKDVLFKASIYLFIISMTLLCASVLKWLFV